MENAQFRSSAFYLSQWASESKSIRKQTRHDPDELDIIENHSNRQVCEGKECTLYFDKSMKTYQVVGNCKRKSLCTETRILKDKLYVIKGSISNTMHCINYENQLLNWEMKY